MGLKAPTIPLREAWKVLLFTLLALVGGLFSGCASSNPPMQTEIVPYTEEQLAARDLARNARYKLRIGDRFSLTFKYEKDLDQNNLIVLPDGYISIAGLGNIKAAGLTLDELNEALVQQYAKDYRNPELTVVVQEIAAPEVYVLGEVQKPGLVKMPAGGTGVLQAVAIAGGFGKDANREQTVVLRAVDQGFMVRTFNFSDINNAGSMDVALFDIQPYDIVYVPRSSLGDFAYLSQAIFGSALNVTRFFWDVYAIINIDEIDRIVR